MIVTHTDHEDWEEKTVNSPEAEQCCAKKSAMDMVRLYAKWSLEKVEKLHI